MFNFDSDGDGLLTDEAWFPTVFDPSSPGTIGDTSPGIGYFTALSASEYTSSAADGERGIILPENTAKTPGAGLEEIYNEAGQLKYSENGVKDIFEEWYGLECIECGSCSFVCPARRPLAQNIKTMKKQILTDKRNQKK